MALKMKLSKLFGMAEATFGTDPDADGSDYKFLPAMDIVLQPGVDVIERHAMVGDLTRQPHVMGGKKGQLSFKLYMKASGTAAGDATAAIAPEADAVLKSITGTVTRGTGDLVEAGSTTTVVNVGDGTRYSKGMLIRVPVSGGLFENRFIRSIAANALTLNRATTSSAVTGQPCYASNRYTRANSSHTSMAFCGFHDTAEYTFLGCKAASAKIVGIGARGSAVLEVTFDVADWSVTTKASLPSTLLSGITAVKAPPIKGAPFAVANAGSNGVAEPIYSLEFDFGSKFEFQESTNGGGLAGGDGTIAGFEMVDAAPNGSFKSFYAAGHLTDFAAGTEKEFDFSCGDQTNGWGIYIPKAQYGSTSREDHNGMVGESLPFSVNDNGTDPEYYLGVF